MSTSETIDQEVILAEPEPQAPAPPAVKPDPTAAGLLTVIERVATDPKIDIDKFERLLAIYREQESRDARRQFYEALSGFQSSCPEIKKIRWARFKHKQGNGYTEYHYASLPDITKAIAPLMLKWGLSYRWEQREEGANITVACIVTHRAGHREKDVMSAGPDSTGSKNFIQQKASTVQYLRRYTLENALGISTAEEDDDATAVEATGEQVPMASEEMIRQIYDQAKQAGRTPTQCLDYINQAVKGRTFASLEGLTKEAAVRLSNKLAAVIKTPQEQSDEEYEAWLEDYDSKKNA